MAADPIRTAIHAALAADNALKGLVSDRIYFQVAPQNATYPLVTFHRQSGRTHRFADMSVVQDDIWTVKGVALKAAEADEIAAAIDGALDNHALSVSGKDTISLLRESDVDFPEDTDGTVYRHKGAMYRLRTA